MYWYNVGDHDILSISQMLYHNGKPVLSIYLMDNELLFNSTSSCSYRYPINITLHALLQRYPSLSPINLNWETKISTVQQLCNTKQRIVVICIISLII
jgi:hypothetical protein